MENEWNFREPLPEGEDAMKAYVTSLNEFTGSNPQFYARDCTPDGFSWVDFSDTNATVVSFLRFAENSPPMLCVFNMTPVDRNNYRIGVPCMGKWRVLFNSGYPHDYTAEAVSIRAHGSAQSIEVNLKALCCSVLSPL